MPLINHAKKEINAKLIYFGPAAAGKATNLNYIYSKLKEAARGKFKSMELQKDRMLFFDFLPSTQGSVNGYSIRFHVYTITGNVNHGSSWKMVLKGVDGLVFVADSRPDGMAANAENLRLLNSCLASYGKSVADVPCVFQCNKQDVPHAVAADQMGRALNPENLPLFPAVATSGEGVLETIFGLVKIVLKNIKASGIDLEEQPEQLQQITELTAQAGAEGVGPFGASTDTDRVTPSVTGQPKHEKTAAIAEEEPVVEVDGGPELLEGGGLRLPLSIRYGSKVKKVTLNISLTPSDDE